MQKISTIGVEFVRPGPSHNQLLSPLTRYLALCGDFPAADLAVPYEHSYFMRRLQGLHGHLELTESDQKQRRAVLDELGQRMAELLDQVPGLAAGFANARSAQRPITHLQLTMSAAELALLPFELSAVPPSCGGAGKNLLLLQNEVPLCMTRTVRGISSDHIRWPSLPRILFVAAKPAGLRIPLDAHVQALLAAVLPLANPRRLYPDEDPEMQTGRGSLREAIKDYMTVLPNATIYDVQEACRHTAYTHVHVLAHGIEDKNSEGGAIGLAMAGKRGGIDVVTGDRFATALKTTTIADGHEATSLPAVVTLATCQSGKMEDVVYSGASFAHEIHQAGVPFVVASQFPLSFEGSVHMVGLLYRKLLLGEDPRIAIHTVRRKLYALKAADTHDWASLVVYAALPSDLEQQLEKAKYELARKTIDMALMKIDIDIKKAEKSGNKDKLDNITKKSIKDELKKVKQKASQLPTSGAYTTEAYGLKGATYKRIAEEYFRVFRLKGGEKQRQEKQSPPECYETLIESRGYYWQAVRENFEMSKEDQRIKASRHWSLVQYLCLGAVMGEKLSPDYWFTAKASAEFDVKFGGIQSQIEAHSSLAELYLLLLAYKSEIGPRPQWKILPPKTKVQEIKDESEAHIQSILDLADDDETRFIIYATKRQLKRYIEWWGSPVFEAILPEKIKAGRKNWSEPKEQAVIEVAGHLETLLPDISNK